MNRFVFAVICNLFSPIIIAQSIPDKFSMLFLSFDFSSNTNTFGVIESGIKQPNYATSLSFYSKYNFDITYSGILTDNADSSFTGLVLENDLSAGYTFELNNKFSIYPSYCHLFHSENSYALKSAITDIVQTDFTYMGEIYNGSITASYMLGDKNTFYGSIQNSFGLSLEDKLFKNSLLSIQLGFYLNLSDNNFYNKLIYDSWNSTEFLDWVDSKYSTASAYVIKRMVLQNGLETTKEYINEPDLFTTDYNLTSIDFSLPVYYSVGNFMFNLTSYLSVPTIDNEFYDRKPTFFFNAGISYAFSL